MRSYSSEVMGARRSSGLLAWAHWLRRMGLGRVADASRSCSSIAPTTAAIAAATCAPAPPVISISLAIVNLDELEERSCEVLGVYERDLVSSSADAG